MKYEWGPRPPTMKQRVVAGVLLALAALASANLYFEWRIFGDYDEHAEVLAFVAMIFAIAFWMPTVRRT